MTIRPISKLSLDEIRLIARDQADAGEPCAHSFELGSDQEAVFEVAYRERLRETRLQEARHVSR